MAEKENEPTKAEPEKAPEKVEEKKKKDRKPHLMAAVEEAFKKWDITGDGAISRYELHAALTQLGMDEAQVAKCFNSADISKDGMLQYDEFLDWVFKDPTVVCAYSLKTAKGAPRGRIGRNGRRRARRGTTGTPLPAH